MAAAKAQVPDRAFSGVAKGDWPAVKGYYRMIDQPEESAVSMPSQYPGASPEAHRAADEGAKDRAVRAGR